MDLKFNLISKKKQQKKKKLKKIKTKTKYAKLENAIFNKNIIGDEIRMQ